MRLEFLMDELLQDFLGEAEELIEALIDDVQRLRLSRDDGRTRRELIARMFRHVHTLKGSAAAVELSSANRMAHEFESLLDGVRLGRVAVDEAVLAAFDEAISAIAHTLRRVARGGQEVPPPPVLIETLRRLAQPLDTADANLAAEADALTALPEEIARSLSEPEEQRLREALGEGARLYLVAVKFDLATFDEGFRRLTETLGEIGEVVSTTPGMEDCAPDQIGFRLVYVADIAETELTGRLAGFDPLTLTQVGAATAEQTDETRASDTESGAAAQGVGRERPVTASLQQEAAGPLTSLVRVELNQLDEMISAAHELFWDTMGTLDRMLRTNLPPHSERYELEMRAARIRRRFAELEESLLGLRMIPVAQTLARAARGGLMAARAVGKDVEFETHGGEVRLDKSLADAITEPLLHLLRNAVDHGIGSPEERVAAGKPARGRVSLEAFAEGSRVRLRIKDDGRGIALERVLRIARERGLVAEDESVTERENLRLIFSPGLTTAGEVSDISGRGVGLDAVERAVEQMGGEVLVRSSPGAGTTFELLLPTTLALVPSLVVRSAGQRYCIGASYIAEAGLVSADEIETLGMTMTIRWRGSIVPLVNLRALLSQSPELAFAGNRLHVIILRHGMDDEAEPLTGAKQHRTAIAVDGWDGHREVLVRGLGSHATRWRGVSGAAELGDGAVALVLDLPRLLEMAF